LKSGNPNLLEPSGPVQVCAGIAILLSFSIFFPYEIWKKMATIVTSVLNPNIPYFKYKVATSAQKEENRYVSGKVSL
jgi:hypothetical protein